MYSVGKFLSQSVCCKTDKDDEDEDEIDNH